MEIALIFLISLLFNFTFRLKWLEDWDSIQFALGIRNFSLINHQPQPPGYPLYIFFAKIINFFFKNETFSLMLLSIFLGSLTLIIFYLLAKNISDKISAVLSVILVTITPVHLLSSISALSDIPGEFFTTFSAFLIYKGRRSIILLLIGSFLSGISLGIRFAGFSTVISLLILVYAFRKSLSNAVRSLMFFLLGTIVWLIPMILITGWGNFIRSYTQHSAYIINHDSFLSYPSFIQRIIQFSKLFIQGYAYFFIPILAFIVYRFAKNKIQLKKFENLFIFIWLFSYLIPLITIYNLEVTRFVLPLLIPIALLFAKAIMGFTRNGVFLGIFTIIVISIFTISFQRVVNLKKTIPPTVAPVLYVKDNFDPKNTILITSFTFRHFQYYAPEFINFWGLDKTPLKLVSKYIIVDFENFTKDTKISKSYNILYEKVFEGPKEIFPRVPKTNLYILTKEE